jgi:hypothetical protein
VSSWGDCGCFSTTVRVSPLLTPVFDNPLSTPYTLYFLLRRDVEQEADGAHPAGQGYVTYVTYNHSPPCYSL